MPIIETDDCAILVCTGERLISNSGRRLSPVPMIICTTNTRTQATLARLRVWLLAEALAEARAMNNGFIETILKGISPAAFAPMDWDTCNDVLFGNERGPLPKHRLHRETA